MENNQHLVISRMSGKRGNKKGKGYIIMIYTVKRIDEDLDFGCEERAKDAPVMAVVTLVDSSGEELRVKAEDALLYKNNINEGDKVCYDKNDPDSVISHI